MTSSGLYLSNYQALRKKDDKKGRKRKKINDKEVETTNVRNISIKDKGTQTDNNGVLLNEEFDRQVSSCFGFK